MSKVFISLGQLGRDGYPLAQVELDRLVVATSYDGVGVENTVGILLPSDNDERMKESN